MWKALHIGQCIQHIDSSVIGSIRIFLKDHHAGKSTIGSKVRFPRDENLKFALDLFQMREKITCFEISKLADF